MRRNQLGGQIGTDPIFTPTSHTGRPAPDATAGLCRPRLTLTAKERALYDGEFGPVLQKTIRAVVDYGEIFGASRLIPLKAAPHHAVSWGSRGIEPLIRLYRELADAGLRTYAPFTANPKPLDTIRLPMASDQLTAAEGVFSFMEELEQLNFELGMCSPQYWSCTCYEPEMGNAPEPGDYLAWSESSAVTFVNSVIGARSNRNPIGIDMLCSILGRAPYFGLMTDRGRQATWLVKVRTSRPWPAQVLGSTIGLRVMEGIPLVTGLNRFLSRTDPLSNGYLKDLGAAIASNGGANLIHIEGVTPEAVRWGHELLSTGFETYVVDDDEIDRVQAGDPNQWKNRRGKPQRVFLGCPHLTVAQMAEWGRRIVDAVETEGASKIGIPTSLFGSHHVRTAFEQRHPRLADKLQDLGVRIPSNCPMMWCSLPLEDAELVATNSSKTKVFTTARYFDDDVLLQLIVTGELHERGR